MAGKWRIPQPVRVLAVDGEVVGYAFRLASWAARQASSRACSHNAQAGTSAVETAMIVGNGARRRLDSISPQNLSPASFSTAAVTVSLPGTDGNPLKPATISEVAEAGRRRSRRSNYLQFMRQIDPAEKWGDHGSPQKAPWQDRTSILAERSFLTCLGLRTSPMQGFLNRARLVHY